MLGKNPFRWLLFFVLAIVVLRLCYNLGYRAVTNRLKPASEAQNNTARPNRQAQALRGVIAAPTDSVATTDPTPETR